MHAVDACPPLRVRKIYNRAAGVEQPGLNEWAAPTLSTAGYTARPAPTPLQPPESATEAAIQSCLLSLNAPSGAVYSCSGLAELVARLEARGLKVRIFLCCWFTP